MLVDYGPAALALLLAAFALAGAFTGWILVRLLQEHVDAASLARCASTILPNETVVLAEVEASEASRVLAILRDVEAEAPVTPVDLAHPAVCTDRRQSSPPRH
jgi:hypothetical protein